MVPKIITRGLQIMTVEVAGVKFLDSLNFIPLPLSQFPKTFNITELKKGFFPYGFNRVENMNYIGSYPDVEFYGIEKMKTNEREIFLAWHKKKTDSNEIFDFKVELISYCENDVLILKQACIAFKNLFVQETGIDPFVHSISIAAACNVVFKKSFSERKKQ